MYRIDILLKQDQKLFHTNDLAILWNIPNLNTLYTVISRYVKKHILFRIHKGFYSTIPPERIHPIRLASGFLHTYSYLSTESVLGQAGIIFQKGLYFTLISDSSRKFSLAGNNFLARKMKNSLLYQPAGIMENENSFTASPERAVADMLYFNPSYHFDNPDAIDWIKVNKIRKEAGFI